MHHSGLSTESYSCVIITGSPNTTWEISVCNNTLAYKQQLLINIY